MSLRARWLWSVFLVWHLLAMAGSMFRETPIGTAIRDITKPYEKVLGVHQTWTMFVPNAPRSTQWAEAIGVLPSGEHVLMGSLADNTTSFTWQYDRFGKFERNVLPEKKGALRTGYTRALCRMAAEEGVDLRGVVLVKNTQPTPPPSERGDVARSAWPIDQREFRERPCPP